MNSLLDPRPKTFAGAGSSEKPALFSILYAEDNLELRHVYTRILKAAGYLVTSVNDGAKAWELLDAGQFDLLVTDNEMPCMTGLELAAKVRLSGMSIPIIVASGLAAALAGPSYEWLLFSSRLQKPFSGKDLLDAVSQALGPGNSTS
jgi:CheY-like chemotaxis protein